MRLCSMLATASFFAEDVEFYHDQGGVTLGRAALTDSVQKNICGRVTRELVPGTLQVFHRKGYGAVATGVHRFHHQGHEDTEAVGEGKFVHLCGGIKTEPGRLRGSLATNHRAAAIK
jgi:hypothetical protein